MIPVKKPTAEVEAYFADLLRLRASGGATGERSSYLPLANLLNAVGGSLKPKVFCVIELADQGSGHPDMGLYAAKQVRKGEPREGQIPERGAVELKSAKAALGTSEGHEQVTATGPAIASCSRRTRGSLDSLAGVARARKASWRPSAWRRLRRTQQKTSNGQGQDE